MWTSLPPAFRRSIVIALIVAVAGLLGLAAGHNDTGTSISTSQIAAPGAAAP
jgi:hypothetical protein